MKGKLVIGESDDYRTSQTSVSKWIEPYGYEVIIDVPLEEDFISLISKPYDFEESIKLTMEVQEDKPEDVAFLEDFRKNRLQYLTDAEYIVIKASPKEIAEYIKNNPILQTKKILFEIGLDLDASFVNELSEAFGSNTSNIYFDVIGNSDLITFSEYKATTDAITNMINEIEKLNFSPTEKIMYAYDIVRNKVYVEVDENENKMISRNLSSSLLGDKIVCVGYAVIFRTLLNLLEIDCKELHLYHPDRKGGHARNLIYVKDEKYGIDGVYYFDPTWGSKEKENDNEYLYSYRYFAMTREVMDEIDNGRYVDDDMPYPIDSVLWDFEDRLDEQGWDKIPKDMVKQINHMSYLIGGDTIIHSAFISPLAPQQLKPTKEQVVEKFYPVLDYYDRQIPAETMLQILYNVRKMQFYTMPDKFPFGMNEFFKTVFMSHWEFNGTSEERLAMEFATPKEKGRIKLGQFAKYAQKTDLQRQIEEIKLTRILRNVYEEKSRKSR